MKKIALILSSLFLIMSASAAHAVTVTYTFDGLQDIDEDFPIFADGFIADSGTILDVNVYLEVEDEFADNLDIWLVHNGVEVFLIESTGDQDEAYIEAWLDDEAVEGLPDEGEIDGTFKPVESLSLFDSLDAQGLWSLGFLDVEVDGDGTELYTWSLEITYADDFVAADVPEPAALGLLGLGLVGFGLARRRRS